jgi:molybdate transport system ATP-binding protein
MLFSLSLQSANLCIAGKPLLQNINFTLSGKEFWAVTGETGSGKSLLASVLSGHRRLTSGHLQVNENNKIVVADFGAILPLPQNSGYYYQQRYNSFDAEHGPLVKEYFAEINSANSAKIFEKLNIRPLYNKHFIQLSTGESKRVLLANALLKDPDLLILDNPLTGLDLESRKQLLRLIDELYLSGTRFLFIGEQDELPSQITNLLVLETGNIAYAGLLSEFKETEQKINCVANFKNFTLPEVENPQPYFEFAVRMKKINVRYGKYIILKDVDWNVRQGEKWVLKGENGSGKSTLLSLITGDNPQAYSNKLWLFDRKRGTGESIWDIKRRIGFVSPELQLYSHNQGSCIDVALSGFFDTIGSVYASKEEQRSIVEEYFNTFNIDNLKDKNYRTVSSGEQRLVLLIRALIKNPPLLIFDEPCLGLGPNRTTFFNEIVDYIAAGKTLIYVSHYDKYLPKCITNEKILQKEN